MLFTRVAIVVKFLLAGFGLAVLLLILGVAWLRFPEHDYRLVVPPLTAAESDSSERLKAHVRTLAEGIGPRNLELHPDALAKAAAYIEDVWVSQGYQVSKQDVPSPRGMSQNLFVDLPGTDPSAPKLILGAHFDTFDESPGANDNGTGVGALLELSRLLRDANLKWPIRFVAFTNEEPPEYRTASMGSSVYVAEFGNEPIAMMISLETIGFYSKDADSQFYPWPIELLYPSVGDFVGLVGDLGSRPLTRRLLEGFRRVSHFPAGAITLPDEIEGMGWSDHWPFWKKRIPAVMLTDTAVYRYAYYHTRDDTLDKINFVDLSRVVSALNSLLRDPGFDPVVPYGFTGR